MAYRDALDLALLSGELHFSIASILTWQFAINPLESLHTSKPALGLQGPHCLRSKPPRK